MNIHERFVKEVLDMITKHNTYTNFLYNELTVLRMGYIPNSISYVNLEEGENSVNQNEVVEIKKPKKRALKTIG